MPNQPRTELIFLSVDVLQSSFFPLNFANFQKVVKAQTKGKREKS